MAIVSELISRVNPFRNSFFFFPLPSSVCSRMAPPSVIKMPAALQRAFPSSHEEWRPFLRRALRHPLSKVPFPSHFYIHSFTSKKHFSPHKPLMRSLRQDKQSAVLVLLSPCGEVLTSCVDSSSCPDVGSSTEQEGYVARKWTNKRRSTDMTWHHESLRPFPDFCITLTKRSMLIHHHKGELSFPGGHLNDAETPVEAALRETQEEIGLDIPESWVIGTLSPIPTLFGYPVTPILAISPRLLRPYPRSRKEVDSIHYLHMSNLLLRSHEVYARVLKHRSRGGMGPSFFPCFFASSSPTEPSGSVLESSMQDVHLTTIEEDGPYFPLLPENFPGELVWGLTSFITCELIARVGIELQLTAAGEGFHNRKGEQEEIYFDENVVQNGGKSEGRSKLGTLTAESFLQCTNVVARDPAAYLPSSLSP